MKFKMLFLFTTKDGGELVITFIKHHGGRYNNTRFRFQSFSRVDIRGFGMKGNYTAALFGKPGTFDFKTYMLCRQNIYVYFQ